VLPGLSSVIHQIRDGPLECTTGSYTTEVAAAISIALDDHRDWQPARADDMWVNHDLVFASDSGTPINPNNPRRDFWRFMPYVEVPRLR
jgi:hypothetical protein